MPSRAAMLRYRWVTESGTRWVEPSGARENTNASSGSVSPSRAARSSHLPAVLGEHGDALGVERDPAVLVGLGGLLPAHPAVLGDAGLEGDHGAGEIDAGPAQRADLPAPRAHGHHEPDERPPVLVAPRLGHQSGGFRRRGRLRVRPRLRGRVDELDRVDGDPAPPDRTLERTGEDPVDLPDRRLPERPARVRLALHHDAVVVLLVQAARPARPAAVPDRPALVRRGGPMIDPGRVSAVLLALAHLSVERVQHLAVQPAHGQPTDQRPDVLVDVPDVGAPGRLLDIEHLEVPVEELVDGGSDPWVSLLVHLVQQAGMTFSASLSALGPGAAEAALDHYRQALDVAGRIGQRYWQARAHDGIGHIMAAANDRPAARAHWQQALKHYRDLGVPKQPTSPAASADPAPGHLHSPTPPQDPNLQPRSVGYRWR